MDVSECHLLARDNAEEFEDSLRYAGRQHDQLCSCPEAGNQCLYVTGIQASAEVLIALARCWIDGDQAPDAATSRQARRPSRQS